jgi:hypothetical protein
MSIIQMAFSINLRPFKEPLMNKIEFLNEAIYYTVLALCFSFTYYNSDEQFIDFIGFIVNSFIYCMLALNLLVILMSTLIFIYRFAKKIHLKYEAKKKIKEI